MTIAIGRRRMMAETGALLSLGALAGCAGPMTKGSPSFAASSSVLQLPRINAGVDRITRINVCTRPFRPQGPRLDVESIAGKTVVHNYGHGGSGWSLSWGSSAIASDKALATGEKQIAVIGAGALGLTSALTLQRAGAKVVIYAKELPPNVRSSLATGSFTPASRICFEEHVTPAFKTLWEGMCRRSFLAYQDLLGLPGDPIEYIDTYAVVDSLSGFQPRERPAGDTRPEFARLQRELTPDLIVRGPTYGPGQHPFGQRYVRPTSHLMFNIVEYSHYLLSEFHQYGGRIEITEFHNAAEFARLPERTIINATGYGARALLGDNSIIPVRGQTTRGIPQPDVHYGLSYRGNSFLPRRDGFLFQHGGDEYQGFNDATALPDRAEAEDTVKGIAQLFAGS